MKDATYTIVGNDPLECLRHEILAEDIIKQLRNSLESFTAEMKEFIRESLLRGFDRDMVKHSISVFMEEIANIIALAENSLAYSTSPKARILENELLALKNSLGVFVSRSEMVILEKPVLENQLIFDNPRRVR